MAENRAENTFGDDVESSNEELRKTNNFQRNRYGGKKNRYSDNQDDPNRNQTGTENQEENNENTYQKRPFGKPYGDRSEHNIHQIAYDATLELPPLDLTEKKFGGRNRIYIANIGNDLTEEDLQELFKPYGETSEVFLNKGKNFAFLKMDYHVNAVKARRELDGASLKSRILRMKISPSCAIVKVKNLVSSVSGELLYYAFAPFGEIQNATVSVDERGKSIGEGIIDFTRKHSAIQAIQKCKEKCYFLSYSLRPVVVEPYEIIDQSVGLLDKHFSMRNNDFTQERSVGPRLAEIGSFEHDYGTRWKTLFELNKQKEDALRLEFRLECEKLEAQMEYARYEHETEALREQLRARELDKDRQKREWEAKERQAEEEKERSAALIRKTQEDMQNRFLRQQEDMRRRQEEEESLLLQAQNLSSILDTQDHLDYDAPSSSTRDMALGGFDSFNTSQNSLLGNYDQSWSNKSGVEGHWVREGGRNRGGNQPKRRRF